MKRWFWPGVSGVLALALAWVAWTNGLLHENAALCRETVAVQREWCAGLQDVNAVCEATIVDVAIRLGLDTDWMPLVTTALWRRASDDLDVRKARRELGAKHWQKASPLAGIGGGDDTEPEVPVPTKPKRRK